MTRIEQQGRRSTYTTLQTPCVYKFFISAKLSQIFETPKCFAIFFKIWKSQKKKYIFATR